MTLDMLLCFYAACSSLIYLPEECILKGVYHLVTYFDAIIIHTYDFTKCELIRLIIMSLKSNKWFSFKGHLVIGYISV